MNDYKDIINSAKEKGITLDACGTDERQYWNGLYNDLCGMSVEDALLVQYWHNNGGTSESKKQNTITFSLTPISENKFELILSALSAPSADVKVSFSLDNTAYTQTLPLGTTSLNTGIFTTTKYAVLTNVTFSTSDEIYKYNFKNNIPDGIFKLTYLDTNNEVISTEHIKFGTNVTLAEVPSKYQVGYDFEWRIKGETTPLGKTFTMPESDTVIVAFPTLHKWTLKYDIEGEGTYSSLTVDYNSKIIDPIPETREGFTFAWEAHVQNMPDNDLTINGKYTKIEISSTVYYDYFDDKESNNITEEQIKKTNHYDGALEKKKSFKLTVSASTECIEWASLRDAADDEGNTEEALRYDKLIDDWKTEHQYSLNFAIPNNLTFSQLTNSGFVVETEIVKELSIDNITYTLRRTTAKVQQNDQNHDTEFTIIIS